MFVLRRSNTIQKPFFKILTNRQLMLPLAISMGVFVLITTFADNLVGELQQWCQKGFDDG
jgi:hypothetical protein